MLDTATTNLNTIDKIVSFPPGGQHLFPILGTFDEDLDEKEDDLDSTENGESSEEAHGATNHPKGRLESYLEIFICKVLFTVQET